MRDQLHLKYKISKYEKECFFPNKILGRSILLELFKSKLKHRYLEGKYIIW